MERVCAIIMRGKDDQKDDKSRNSTGNWRERDCIG